MNKFRRPVCPYCGKKVNPIRTWSLKLEGEYKCVSCNGISNIVLDTIISIFAAVAIIVSIIIFLVYRFLFGEITLAAIIFMLIPYLLFFIFSLFLVRLKRPIVREQTSVTPPSPVARKRPSPPASTSSQKQMRTRAPYYPPPKESNRPDENYHTRRF